MSLSVNPVSSSYYANAAAVAYANNANTVNTYDALLAVENQYLSGVSSGSSSGSGSSVDSALATSDLLSLSPAALNILNGVDNLNGIDPNTQVSDTVGFNGTVGNTTTLTLTGNVSQQSSLNATQQAQAAAIIAQYASEPATLQTFTQIENALTAAGINPSRYRIQQLLGAYNLAYEPSFAFNGQLFTETLGV